MQSGDSGDVCGLRLASSIKPLTYAVVGGRTNNEERPFPVVPID